MNALPLYAKAVETPDGTRVQAKGVLDCDGHRLPFSYHVSVDAEATEHAERLDAFHAKGLVWSSMKDGYAAWSGTTESLGDVSISVVYSGVRPFGANDWRLTVIWDETVDGATRHRARTWQRAHPGELPSLETAQELVRAEAVGRAGQKAKAAVHLEAVRLLGPA